MFCNMQMKTRPQQLRSEFQYLSKGTHNIIDFIACFSAIVDTLISIEALVLHIDQIEFIPEALPTEYDLVIDVVNVRSKFLSVDEVKSLMLTQESRIEKTKKEVAKTIIVT